MREGEMTDLQPGERLRPKVLLLLQCLCTSEFRALHGHGAPYREDPLCGLGEEEKQRDVGEDQELLSAPQTSSHSRAEGADHRVQLQQSAFIVSLVHLMMLIRTQTLWN